MPIRKVKGHIEYVSGDPWIGANIHFKLTPGSYTDTTQYPSSLITAIADDYGNFESLLWTNESGELASNYICYLPDGQSFSFTLPTGTADIDLSLLRVAGITETNTQYSTLITYVNTAINESIVDTFNELAPALVEANANIYKLKSAEYSAASSLNALRVVVVEDGKFVYANNTNMNHTEIILGILEESLNNDEIGRATIEGEISNNNWNWQLFLPIFLGVDGILTQSMPTTGFIKKVAFPITTNKVYFKMEQAIIHGN